MAKARTYSRYSIEATTLLGKQIKLGRKQRKWTEHELADRAGISRGTLQKIEKGSMTCAIGLVFEVAMLAGVKLFDTEKVSSPCDQVTPLAMHLEMTSDKIALLPKAVRTARKAVDDDF